MPSVRTISSTASAVASTAKRGQLSEANEMAATAPQTTPEVGGMGHSVKRKEDPRFIRGQGEYIDDLVLPGKVEVPGLPGTQRRHQGQAPQVDQRGGGRGGNMLGVGRDHGAIDVELAARKPAEVGGIGGVEQKQDRRDGKHRGKRASRAVDGDVQACGIEADVLHAAERMLMHSTARSSA